MTDCVTYLGRYIVKKGFRTFVYGKDSAQALAENWDSYQKMIHSGEWFSTKEEAELHFDKKNKVEVAKATEVVKEPEIVKEVSETYEEKIVKKKY